MKIDPRDFDFVANIDGACSGNPGPGSWAVVASGGLVRTGFLPHTTSNVAEWNGMIQAIVLAKARKASSVLIRSDSKLVVSQLLGKWRCKDSRMVELRQQARQEIASAGFVRFEVQQIPREQNEPADTAAGDALSGGRSRSRRSDLIESCFLEIE